MSLADRVMKLASDAARLASELLPQQDVLHDLIDRMRHHDVRVTHGAHALFAASGTAFVGAEPFRGEELILRAQDGMLALEYPGALRWLAINTKIPQEVDLILALDFESTGAGAANAFIRCRFSDGKHVDGPRAALGEGHVQVDRYIHHPPVKGEGYTSQLFVTFDHVSQAVIRKLALAFDRQPE